MVNGIGEDGDGSDKESNLLGDEESLKTGVFRSFSLPLILKTLMMWYFRLFLLEMLTFRNI